MGSLNGGLRNTPDKMPSEKSSSNFTLKRSHLNLFKDTINRCSYVFKNTPETIFQELQNRLQAKALKDNALKKKLNYEQERYTKPWLRCVMGNYENPIISVLTGHSTGITDCSFSPKGSLLVSTGHNYEVILWDWKNGELKNILRTPIPYLDECVFSPDGSRIFILASQDDDYKPNQVLHLLLYSTDSGHFFGKFGSILKGMDSIGVNLYKKIIAVPNDNSEIEIVSYQTAEVLDILSGHEGKVLTCAFNEKGDRLASADNQGNIIIWDMQKLDTLDVREWDADKASYCSFNKDLTQLVAAHDNSRIAIWSVETGECFAERRGLGKDWNNRDIIINSCFYAKNNEWIAGRDSESQTVILDAKTLEEISKFEDFSHVRSKSLTHDAKMMVTAGGPPDYSAYVWDTVSGNQIARLRGHTFEIETCTISPDGRTVATVGCDRSIMIWDVNHAREIEVKRKYPHDGSVRSLAISPDSRFLLTAAFNDQRINLWDVSNLCLIKNIFGYDKIIKVNFSNDGSMIVSTGEEKTKEGAIQTKLKVWDTLTGNELWSFLAPERLIFPDLCFFSPDDNYILFGKADYGYLFVVDANRHAAILQMDSRAMYKVNYLNEKQTFFFPERHVFIIKDKSKPTGKRKNGEKIEQLVLLDINNNKEKVLYEGFDEFQEIDISPDGKTLGIAKKNEVQFLDIFTGTVINTKLCQGEVDSMNFSPDGQHFCVVTYPEDKQHLALTVFSWETENPIYTFYWDVLAEGTSICGFSPDGKRIYWSSDEQAKIFYIETGNSITLNMKIGGMVQITTSLDGKYLTFGDKFGDLFIFQLENTNFEPRIVTPLIDESNIYFKCPYCTAKNNISESDFGKEQICENCKATIRLNNFTCAL